MAASSLGGLGAPGRLARLRQALTPGEWAAIGGVSAVVVLLHVVGWFTLVAIVSPHHYHVGSRQVFGVGLGVTAYTLGMRHAFDADHIAAIDNTTRKLMADGRRPVSVGFWFSLGHSSIVFALCALLSFGVRSLVGQVQHPGSALHNVAGVIGTSVSGVFLWLIGLVNLVILMGILRVFRGMRRGVYDEATLEEHLNNRGLMNRLLGGLTRSVRKPWQIFPVGLLFGLGFDTASEVALLVIAGGAAAMSLPWYAILTLPVLFAAGMSLLDSIDGCFMNFAYGWAFSRPVRKVYYNITITALSVAVALIVGTIELLSVIAQQLSISHGPLAWVGNLNLNNVGFFIVGLFVLTWVVALAVWHFADVEHRWSAGLAAVTEPE